MKNKKKFLIIGLIIFVVYVVGAIGSSLDSQNGGSEEVSDQISITLSLEDKQKVFYEVVEAEDRAQKEADSQYPTDSKSINEEGLYQNKEKLEERIDNNATLSFDLQEQYRMQILEKYNLTEEQWKSIALEGAENDWPMPNLE